jgi:hypothetical protein
MYIGWLVGWLVGHNFVVLIYRVIQSSGTILKKDDGEIIWSRKCK